MCDASPVRPPFVPRSFQNRGRDMVRCFMAIEHVPCVPSKTLKTGVEKKELVQQSRKGLHRVFRGDTGDAGAYARVEPAVSRPLYTGDERGTQGTQGQVSHA